MDRGRRTWYAAWVDWLICLRGDRPDPSDMERRRRRESFETDTARMGVRMTPSLRDRLRQRWLKLKRS